MTEARAVERSLGAARSLPARHLPFRRAHRAREMTRARARPHRRETHVFRSAPPSSPARGALATSRTSDASTARSSSSTAGVRSFAIPRPAPGGSRKRRRTAVPRAWRRAPPAQPAAHATSPRRAATTTAISAGALPTGFPAKRAPILQTRVQRWRRVWEAPARRREPTASMASAFPASKARASAAEACGGGDTSARFLAEAGAGHDARAARVSPGSLSGTDTTRGMSAPSARESPRGCARSAAFTRTASGFSLRYAHEDVGLLGVHGRRLRRPAAALAHPRRPTAGGTHRGRRAHAAERRLHERPGLLVGNHVSVRGARRGRPRRPHDVRCMRLLYARQRPARPAERSRPTRFDATSVTWRRARYPPRAARYWLRRRRWGCRLASSKSSSSGASFSSTRAEQGEAESMAR